MFRLKVSGRFFLIIFVMAVTLGCSQGGANLTAPNTPTLSINHPEETSKGRYFWGMWDIQYDTAAGTVTAALALNAQIHKDVTKMILPPNCNSCLQLGFNYYNPLTEILNIDVTLYNKVLPTGHDVRGIIFTTDTGISLTNADDWTPLWDIPGGQDINPFIAYAKSQPARQFAANAKFKEKFLIHIPNPPKFTTIKFAVDASWPGNCREPYSIDHFAQANKIYGEPGSTCELAVDVHDWQNDVGSVRLNAPEITGVPSFDFYPATGDNWELSLENVTGEGPGDYVVLIEALSKDADGIPLYDYATVTIAEGPIQFAPRDITPQWLNMEAEDICVRDNYAFVADDIVGLQIYDVTDPGNPVWVNCVKIPGGKGEITLSGGYAYIASEQYGLYIVNISPPESAHIVKNIKSPDGKGSGSIAVSGNYAYMAVGKVTQIININPPGSADTVKVVNLPTSVNTVAVSGSYACAAGSKGFYVIAVEPPESAHVIGSMVLDESSHDVELSGNYAYLANCVDGLRIIDISSPDSPHIINTLKPLSWVHDVAISGDYAFIVGGNYSGNPPGLHIYDISSPEASYPVCSVQLKTYWQISVSGGYAYVTGLTCGISIIDINPLESAYLVKTIDSPVIANDATLVGNYCFVADGYDGIQTIDVQHPEQPCIIRTDYISEDLWHIASDSKYVYVSGSVDDFFSIFKLNTPGPLQYTKTLELPDPDDVHGIAVAGDYAYVASWFYDVYIIDISPPQLAYIANVVETSSMIEGISEHGGYVFVCSGGNLDIIDVTPPESAYIVKSVESVGGVSTPAIDNGYCYVTNSSGVLIIDIDPPESAHVVNSVPLEWPLGEIAAYCGYAYATGREYSTDTGRLDVIDVNPPEDAHVVASAFMPGIEPRNIAVSNGYAYISARSMGLRIIDLW